MKNEESQFISLAEAAKITNYSQDYISLLCRQGKLRAEKLGRNWVTKKEWVYSYIDNTEGKGESIVPVRIKEKPEGKNAGRRKKTGKPFFAYNSLECALFCFAVMIWSVNIYAFNHYAQRRDFNAGDRYSQTTLASLSESSLSAFADDSCASDDIDGCDVCRRTEDIQNLDAFEKETDAKEIAFKQAEIAEKFGEGINSELYKTFAVLSDDSYPGKKFLYVFPK